MQFVGSLDLTTMESVVMYTIKFEMNTGHLFESTQDVYDGKWKALLSFYTG